ncbi:hypothetical protein N288_06130 [Bacillus infantis NRRL B-14911]|uniref:Uncharacterized protein n=1 Tax=Bacillus infantis NRRL B-14911 TaxID=1367477 RepID=U5L6X6_9BACI|nr:hypothetical protein N288_06130 [Bacillus infantis NRRL B-14911]
MLGILCLLFLCASIISAAAYSLSLRKGSSKDHEK